MLSAEIIAIGSELLTPQFHDTNATFLTEQLNLIGITVKGTFKQWVSAAKPGEAIYWKIGRKKGKGREGSEGV